MNTKKILLLSISMITASSYTMAPMGFGAPQLSPQQSMLSAHQPPQLSHQQSLLPEEEEKKEHEAEVLNQEPTMLHASDLQSALLTTIDQLTASSRPRSNSFTSMFQAITYAMNNSNDFQRVHEEFFRSNYDKVISDYTRLLHSGLGTEEQRRIASINLGESHLGLGHLQEGFAWRERRISAEAGLSTDKLWNGKSDLKQKKLLIRPEGGFGDIAFFQLRYIPLVQAEYPDCKIVLEGNLPQRSIYELLDNVTIVGPGACQDYDYTLHGMSLPCYFSTKGQKPTTLDTIPSKAYLKAKPELIAQWEARLRSDYIEKGILPIGIFWAASANPGGVSRTYERDIDPTLLIDTLVDCGNVALINLQGPGSKPVVQNNKVLIDFEDFDGKKSGPFQDTAALMVALKNVNGHVVGIDTGALNFAGASGVDAIGLLPAEADWRWGTNEQTSTWFPSITIARQLKQGDWSVPLAQAQAIIKEKASKLLLNK